MNVSIWELAVEYDGMGHRMDGLGEDDLFILTTPDGEDEITDAIFATPEEATTYAEREGYTIVPLNVEGALS